MSLQRANEGNGAPDCQLDWPCSACTFKGAKRQWHQGASKVSNHSIGQSEASGEMEFQMKSLRVGKIKYPLYNGRIKHSG